MKCSIIIRCLNEAAHLPTLLDALNRQTVRPAEIVVVDSGSRDKTVEIARSSGAKVVHINPGDFTFGRALNLGIRASCGDILVLASAHTYPTGDRWLEALVEPFADPGVALVYGGQTGNQRSKFSELELFKQWFPAESCDHQVHSFCNNANTAIRRSVWETLPYDEQIPALEDIHWAKRAIDRGFRIAYRAQASIVHVHDEPYLQIYRRYRREGMALQMILPWERMRFTHAVSLAAHAIRSDLNHARSQGVLSRVIGSVLRFRLAQYWGTYRGLNWRGSLTSDLRARMYYPRGYQAGTGSDPKVKPPLSEPAAGKHGE